MVCYLVLVNNNIIKLKFQIDVQTVWKWIMILNE